MASRAEERTGAIGAFLARRGLAPAAAVVLGVLGLLGALADLRDPQWWDAAGFYVPYAHDIRQGFPDLIFDSQPWIVHTPVHALVIAAGWLVTGPTTVVPHLVSLLAAVVVLVATYRTVRTHAGPWPGVVAVAILVSVPLFQSQARIATPEMASAACCSMAMGALAARRPLPGGLWLLGATLAKITTVVIVPPVALWAAWLCVRGTGRGRRAFVETTAVVALPALLGLLAWLTYHGIVTNGMAWRGEHLAAGSNPAGEAMTLPHVVHRGAARVRQLVEYAGLGPLLLASLVAVLVSWRGLLRDRLGVILGLILPMAAGIGLLSVTGLPLARYVVPFLPALVAGAVITLGAVGWRTLVAGALPTIVLGLALMWRLPGPLVDPEGNLSYRHLLARDVQVVHVVDRLDDGHTPVRVALPGGAFPYSVLLTAPYLGFGLSTPQHVLAPGDAAPCEEVVIDDEPSPAGATETRLRGGPWPARYRRWVARETCDGPR
ncbi:MAG: Alg9 family protein mannosyltransferase [Acidimicrobiales bacterium]|nr:Alg9 family protein mannosyltransferase [Acidimicrobiales bacterium]